MTTLVNKILREALHGLEVKENERTNKIQKGGKDEITNLNGIANAITRAAQREESWEKSLELEKLGGRLRVLPISRV